MQRVEGISFDSYCSYRTKVVSQLQQELESRYVVFVRSACFWGKTAFARLCERQFATLDGYDCSFLNGLVHSTQSNDTIELQHFRKGEKKTIVIIDEVQALYNNQDKLWNGIRALLHQQTEPPIYFLLFSSSYEGHPIVNDIQFPMYLGHGLLQLSEIDTEELFTDFELKFGQYWANTLDNVKNFKLSSPIKQFLLLFTEGHAGYLVLYLNSLLSTLFASFSRKQPLHSSGDASILMRWFRSYDFYSILTTCRGSPQFDSLSDKENSILQKLLLRYTRLSPSPAIRLQDKNLFQSLYDKRIIRHADEKLGIGWEASASDEIVFCSPLTAQLYFQHAKRSLQTRSIPDLFWQAMEHLNPLPLQHSSSLADSVLHFCYEFYQNVVASCPQELFVSPIVYTHDYSEVVSPLIMLEISISGEESCSLILCLLPSYPLSVDELTGLYQTLMASSFLPNDPLHCIFLSFPSQQREQCTPASTPELCYQGYIRDDFSGIDIHYGQNETRELIFSGHLTLQQALSPREMISSPLLERNPSRMNSPFDISPSSRIVHETEVVKLFVGQIPRTMNEEDLSVLFAPYGDIFEISVIRDKKFGTHCGCAFVTFVSPTSAERAIQNLHGFHTFPGQNRPMQVKLADAEEQKSEHKLFVGMIPENVTERQLKKLFSKFGEITEFVLLRAPDGSSKHCGFVKYSKHSDAVGAINGLNRSFIKAGSAHPLVVKFADTPKSHNVSNGYQYERDFNGLVTPYLYGGHPHSIPLVPLRNIEKHPKRGSRKGPEGCNLFVIRIPPHWTDQELLMNFLPFGNILSATIFVDKATGESRCFGFVSYDNPSSARLAIQNMDGIRLNGKRLTVQLKKRNSPY